MNTYLCVGLGCVGRWIIDDSFSLEERTEIATLDAAKQTIANTSYKRAIEQMMHQEREYDTFYPRESEICKSFAKIHDRLVITNHIICRRREDLASRSKKSTSLANKPAD